MCELRVVRVLLLHKLLKFLGCAAWWTSYCFARHRTARCEGVLILNQLGDLRLSSFPELHLTLLVIFCGVVYQLDQV